MQHQENKSFSNNQLRLYKDGIGIGNWSWRLSHFFKNFSRMNIFITGMFTYGIKSVSATFAQRFFSSQGSNYKLMIDQYIPQFTQIENGVCGLTPDLSSGPHTYELIEKWFLNNGPRFAAGFYRDAHQLGNLEVESCIKKMISDAVTDYQILIKGEIQNVDIKIITTLGIVLAFFWIVYILNECRARNDLDHNERAIPFTDDNVQTTNTNTLFTQNQKRRSNAERLESLGIERSDLPPYAQNFICPISQEIMTNPVITDDGNSYEYIDLKKCKKTSGMCPLDRDKKITFMVPNNNLRGQILEFVENMEKEAEFKKSNHKQSI